MMNTTWRIHVLSSLASLGLALAVLCVAVAVAPAHAAGAAGKCLMLGDFEIFFATDNIPELNELTVMWWNKNYIPGYDAEALQYLRDVEAQTDVAFNWYGNAGPNVGLDRVTTPFPYETGDWTHFAFTWVKQSGFGRLFYNGIQVANGTLGQNWPIGPGGRFYFARPFAPDWINRLYAAIDEVGIYKVALSDSAIYELMSASPAYVSDPIARENVLGYFSFDNVSATAPYTIFSDYSDFTARIVQAPYSILEGLYYYPPVNPPLAPSSAPLLGSGSVARTVRPGVLVPIELVGTESPGNEPILLSLPSEGIVYERDANGLNTSEVTAASLPFTVPNGGIIFYTPAELTQELTFEYSLGGNIAMVHLMPNRAPTPRNTTFYMVADTAGSFWLGRKIYRPLSARLLFSLYTIDPEGDPVTITLLNLPAAGTLSYDSTALNSSMIPMVFDGSVPIELTFEPLPGESGDEYAILDFIVSDGHLQSEISRITINVQPTVLPPVAQPISAGTNENENVVVHFPQAAQTANNYTTPANGGYTIEPVYAVITQFPEHGRLLQASGEQLFAQDDPQPVVRMWASAAVAVSSFWFDETGSFSPEQMLGVPNLFPEHGDDGRAWSPESQDMYEWVILKWPERVYVQSLEVYMTYFGGTTYRISALDYATGEFMHVWEADPLDLIPRKNAAYLFRPQLCPVSFATDTLKLEFAPAGTASYVEVDAVALIGTLKRQVRDLVDIRSDSVTYVPDQNVNGNDQFSYTLNKCSYFSKFGAMGVESAAVSIAIASVNQLPVATNFHLKFDATNSTLALAGIASLFNISDVESDISQLYINIRCTPILGALYDANSHQRLAVGDRIGAWKIVYIPSLCTDSSTVTNDTFSYTVSDGQAQSELANTTITIDCLGPIQKVPLGVQIFVFVICGLGTFISFLFLVLVLVWRESRTIRSISPLFCVINLLGSLLVNISPIFLAPLARSCMAWMCCLSLGVCLFFTPIAAKTFRLERIFLNKSMRIFAITNSQLMLFVGIPTGVQVILLIVWGVVNQPRPMLIQLPDSPQQLEMCSSPNKEATLAVEFLLLLGLYVFTALYAWKVRSIPLGQWKETREIFFSVYQIGFVALVTIPLAFVLWFTSTGYLLIIAVGTVFAATVSICLLFITKFYRIATNQELSAVTHLGPSNVTSGGGGGTKWSKRNLSLGSRSLGSRTSVRSSSVHNKEESSTSSSSSSTSSSSKEEQKMKRRKPKKDGEEPPENITDTVEKVDTESAPVQQEEPVKKKRKKSKTDSTPPTPGSPETDTEINNENLKMKDDHASSLEASTGAQVVVEPDNLSS